MIKKGKIDLKKFKISNSPFAQQLLNDYKKLKQLNNKKKLSTKII